MAVENNNSTTPEAEKDLAQTPKWFIKSLEDHLGRVIDIDVCALAETAKADNYFSLVEGDNSLEIGWTKAWQDAMEDESLSPFCYCNPPFSDALTWVWKCVEESKLGAKVALLLPNNPETEYIRLAKRFATRVIEMPFRMKFLKPDGTEFLDKKGKPQSPKFSCVVFIFEPDSNPYLGQKYYYHDFREGYFKGGKSLV